MGNGGGRSRAVAGVLLVVAVLAIFAPAAKFPFLEFDDDVYVTLNPHVNTGLGWSNAAWAFTAFHSGNWGPLTWISHQLDVSLWGLAPAGHHMTSVLLHTANTLLVLLVLLRMTGQLGPSLFVAALFGLHPQRLESVAWVAERKDVLSAFFGLLALYAWARFVEKPSRSVYVLGLLAFALGLLAKPMLVTLPCVMLLLQLWPLKRRRWIELVPFFVLAAASSAVTLYAERAGGTISSFHGVPVGLRLANAATAYVAYVGQLVWPANLALVYALPQSIPVWQWAGAAVLLLAATALAVASARRRPWLTVGWGWYLGMLVPVIGVIQIGTQAYADRYTYLPSIGLGIAIAWSGVELAAARPGWRVPIAGAAVVAAVALAGSTVRQESYWSSSERLFAHSLAVSPDSASMHNSYAVQLQRQGRLDAALEHFRAALAVQPAFAGSSGQNAIIHNNYGVALQKHGQPGDAEAQFRAALDVDPSYSTAGKNLGNLLLEQKRPDEAITVLQRVVDRVPDYAAARDRLGVALASVGRHDEGLQQLRRATELEPEDPRWREDLVVALLIAGKEAEAIEVLDAAIAGKTGTAGDRYLLGVARFQQRQLDSAAEAFQAALQIDPRQVPALNRLGIVRAQQGRWDEAIDLFRRALAIDPASKETEANLRTALARKGGTP
jgi:tetratricopeptide (TPR) repeat protein